MLSRERKRSERSRKHLLLMLIDGKSTSGNGDKGIFEKISGALSSTVRDTDLVGWFETGSIIGVIFTEFGNTEANSAVKVIENKVFAGLQRAMKANQLSRLFISFYAYPDDWAGKSPDARWTRLFTLTSSRLSEGRERHFSSSGSWMLQAVPWRWFSFRLFF